MNLGVTCIWSVAALIVHFMSYGEAIWESPAFQGVGEEAQRGVRFTQSSRRCLEVKVTNLLSLKG